MLRSCSDFALEEITSLPAQPAADVEGALELAESFDEPAPERGEELGPLLERLRPAIRKSFNTAGPGYLAFIPGGGIPAAAAADLIASAANRYVGVRQAAPVLVQIETTVLEWMSAWLGYPKSARGVLTSGGSLSNLSALVTARSELLGESFLDGVVYVSQETHHSIAKAARIAGIRRA
ncbi:MAG: decarboxylase, partial [Deltaproteobacteria bacterium]|nr:decarboxylase [Deltaproteobacteria bacterium]